MGGRQRTGLALAALAATGFALGAWSWDRQRPGRDASVPATGPAADTEHTSAYLAALGASGVPAPDTPDARPAEAWPGTADVLAGARPASDVYDAATLGRYLAAVELWGARGSLAPHRARFISRGGLLVPVAVAARPFAPPLLEAPALQVPWCRAALCDPEVARAFVTALRALGLPQDPPPQLSRKHRYLIDLVNLSPVAIATAVPAAGASWRLVVRNTTRLPIEVRAAPSATWALIPAPDPDAESSPPERSRTLPRQAGVAPTLEARLVGGASHPVPVTVLGTQVPDGGRRPLAPGTDEALRRHPFLEREGEALAVRAGEWTVSGDLVLPAGVGLRAGPGTTLRFGPGALLLATGPLVFEGTAQAPVRLLPAAARWAGVLVLSAARSTWTHVRVSGTVGLDRDGWMTTGGATFKGGAVTLSRCKFSACSAEDALNVIGGAVTCTDTSFSACASDAFDGDFVSGSFARCRFTNVGGDAIDVSGSRLSVADVVCERVTDKAISAGERSTVVAHRVRVVGARFGAVAKDSSTLNIDGLVLHDVQIGLAAYQKKPEFGPAEIDASGVSFHAVQTPALVQRRSRVTLDGKSLPGQKLDVDKLYRDP